MIRIENMNHHFTIGVKNKQRLVPVLHDIHLHVKQGEIVAIVGRSGSGKSTLLNLISGYIRPVSGTIHIRGKEVTGLTEGDWADFRLQNFGFIFQSFQLISSMTAYDNVELPLVLQGVGSAERRRKTRAILERLGMADYSHHYPGELSGGQQQRVAVARALIVKPPILLADEPTGSLDSENEQELLSLIRELNREEGITFLMITHDEQVAAAAHRTVRLKDGRVVDSPRQNLRELAFQEGGAPQ
jgi:acetoin utilization transport system ATP-binding protein